MVHEIQSDLVVIIALFLHLAGLSFAILSDPYISKKHRRIMIHIIILALSLIVQNVLEYIMSSDVAMVPVRRWVAIYGYSARPLIIVLFFYIVSTQQNHLACWILVIVNALVHLTALFSDICFTITDDNSFHRGPLGYCSFIISGGFLVLLMVIAFQEYGGKKGGQLWIPVFNVLIIVLSVYLDSFVFTSTYMISYLTVAIVSGCIFYYIWLHLQFVREHEQALRAEQRIQIMMSQIQPHFLYNTLTTIQALCRIDPEKAFQITEKFGVYLRQNIDSLSQTELIPLEREIEHTNIYTDIEKVRFPKISIEYNIEDKEFSLPALTVQPLVENAIRYGVRIRENGLVKVTTKRCYEGHEIVIEDNGKGFDPNAPVSTERSHIGLKNVCERIEKMCGGTVNIDSRIGEGTTITIMIPYGKTDGIHEQNAKRK